ncbi:MAG: hypothetical protein KBD76_06475 [Bacteriovorax sp.]|nr:hypothetical protein [Bacteriovorax sp.]
MRILFILSWFFYSVIAKSGCGSLLDGEVVRLDVKGKSLENFKVQDQDGLGTCYSNASSLLLHSATGTTPSYLMLAKNFGDRKSGELKDFYYDENRHEYKLKLEGGEICASIKESKKKQVQGSNLCNQSSTYFELNSTKNGDPIESQKIMLNTFLTWENTSLNNNVTIDSVKYENLKNEAKVKCSVINPDFLARQLYSVFTDIFEENFKDCWGDKLFSEMTKEELAAYKKCETLSFFYKQYFGDRPEVAPSLYGHVLLPPKDKLHFENFINHIIDNIKKYKKSSMSGIDFFRNAGVYDLIFKQPNLSKEMNEALQKVLSTWNEAFQHLNSMKLLAKQLEDQSEGKASKECVNFEILRSLDKGKSEIVTCGYRDIFNDLNILGIHQNEMFDNLINGILSFQPSTVFKEIGLDCDPKDRFKIPNELNCEEPTFIEELPDGTFSPAVVTQEDLNKIKSEHSNKIINSLKENLAVGYSFCTDILDKPGANYLLSNNKKEMCRLFHGHHAVSVSGVSCQNNQLSFLIQNSWGTKWTPENKDLKPEPNGKFWMSEYDFFNNAEALTYMKNSTVSN